ncbi:Bax inhibitor-1/YccA family protein [Burkholderiaceae bacterium DAT-1]|nr:Bax inhibitor-1/YccA family protein [Burkholderiaceae bacterium DAT-1]
MQSQWQTSTYEAGYAQSVDRNKVLRNTYFLLALSMIPTGLGAWFGVAMKFAMSPLMGVLLFLGVSFGFFFAIERTKNSPAGVFLTLGWTGFMGLWLSQYLQHALRFSNGSTLIAMAAAGTAVVLFAMSALAIVSKRDFSFMGKFLFVGVIITLVASLANIFLQIPALMLAVSVMVTVIFSLYILYDVSQIVNGGETNYITATVQLYLDIYNVFISLLNLLMAFGGERD